jgi:uncharacterized membrane protein
VSHPNTTTEAVVVKAAAFGTVGWMAENLLFGPRYSALFNGRRVPFLPVYAAGGLAVTSLAPKFKNWPMLLRGAAYAAIGSGLEYVGCQLDRTALSAHSWNYGPTDGLSRATRGCVDFKHAALWGVAGLLLEKVIQP